jgi:autotransporter-associated beta strand protein
MDPFLKHPGIRAARFVVALMLALLGSVSAQTTFVWTNKSLTAYQHNWSVANQWSNNLGGAVAPASGGSNNYIIAFQTGATFTTTNDQGSAANGGGFLLNQLSINDGSSYTINGSNLIFVSSSGSVGPQLVVNGANISVINNNLVLSNSVTVTGTGVSTAAGLTLNGNLTGAGALIKTGSGVTLTIGGITANTFSGNLTNSAGMISVANNDPNVLGTGVLVFDGGALKSSGSTRSMSNNLAFTADAVLGAPGAGALNFIGAYGNLGTGTRTITISNTANLVTIANKLTNSAALVTAGPGTLVLSGSNSYGGGTTIASGTLRSIADFALGTGAVTVTSGGILQFGTGARTNQSGIISGTGVVDLNSGSTFFLLSSNAYTGSTLISSSGRVALGSDYALGTSTIFFTNASAAVGGNISSIGSATRTLINSLVFSNNALLGNGTDYGTLVLNGNADLAGAARALTLASPVVMNGAITNGRLVIVTTGTGTLTLSGTNTYGLGTILSNGTLIVGNDAALGTGLLTFSGGSLSNVDNHTVANNVNLGNSATISVVGTDVLRLSGTITNSGSLTKLAAGTLTLAGANTYSGNTTNSAGTLALGTNNALGSGVLVMNGGILQSSDSNDRTLANNVVLASNPTFGATTTGNLGLNGAFMDLGTGTRMITVSSNVVTINGNLTNSANLIKSGSGTLVLAGGNHYSGSTTLSNGLLQLGSSVSLTNGSALAINGGALDMAGYVASVGSLSGSSASGSITNNTVLTVNQTANGVFAGVLAGTGNLTKKGASILMLSGANNFGGGVSNAAGMLVISNDAALGTGLLTFSGGSLSNVDNHTVANNVNLGSSATISVVGSDVLTLSGSITNSGNLVKSGSGTLTLLGVNLNSGVLGIGAGQVVLGNAFAAQNATVSNAVANGLVLSNAATAWTFGGLAGTADFGMTNFSGNVITLTVGGNNANTTFSGALTGNGTLIKDGTGSLTLGNAANNLPSLAVSNGTLKLSAALSVSSGMSVGNGAIFDPNAQAVTGSVTIASGGKMSATATTATILPAITGTVSNQGVVLVQQIGGVQEWGGLVNTGSLTLTPVDTGGIEFLTPDSLQLNSGGSITISNNNAATRALIAYNVGPVLTNFGSVTLFGFSTNTASGSARIVVGGVTTGNNGGSNLLVNADGAQIHLISQGGTNANFSITTGADIAAFLRNEGTLTVSGTNASRIINANAAVSGTSTNAGVIAVEDQATLKFYSANSSGRHGFVNLSGGLLSIGQGGAAQVLSVGGAQNGTSAGSFRNLGLVTNLGSIVTFSSLTNAVGGTIISKGSFSTSVVNQGTMTFLGGTSSVTFGTLVNPGSLDFQSGSVLSLAGPFLSQGTVAGSGTVLVNAATNSGTLSPGRSPGTLTFSSNLTLNSASVLNIELGGTNAVDFDHLVANGALNLGGTLNVTLINGYAPGNGDTVDILDWGSIFGTFSTVNLPSVQWSAGNLYSDGTLIYTAVPEPGMALILSLGLGLLIWTRRGKKA